MMLFILRVRGTLKRRRQYDDPKHEKWTGGQYFYFNRTVIMSRRASNLVWGRGSEQVWTNTLMHEIFHALGMEHTHNREDRDKHIKMLQDNVADSYLSEFGELHAVPNGTPYECNSIMHYGPAQGAKNPKNPTFKPHKPSCEGTNGGGPTNNDWKAFQQHLRCPADVQQDDNASIQQDTNDDDCICDDDYDDDFSSEEDYDDDDDDEYDESLTKLTRLCHDGMFADGMFA